MMISKQQRGVTQLAALVLGAIAVMAHTAPARADDAPATTLDRVEVTGSSIKRIQAEGASPVQVLTAEDIKKTGVTTTTDLIQQLPAMQGFVPASSSINGGGGGVTTAALHSLQSKYTLVLLDGKRVAPTALGLIQGAGFGVNLESIPLAAIEKVEILTDGASALYGSDAIAGVVNFILKKNFSATEFYADVNVPQHSGGASGSLGVTTGWGDIMADGYNVLGSYSHDEQESLFASQRSFSKQGAFFNFSSGGTRYVFDQRTGNTFPANVNINGGPSFNPYYNTNGNCGGPLIGINGSKTSCRFNFSATTEDIPKTVRDSLLVKGTLKLNDSTNVYATLDLTRAVLNGQYAPSAQPLGVSATKLPVLWNKYVVPYIQANNVLVPDANGNLVTPTGASLGFRSVNVGGRDDDFATNAAHLSLGIDGDLASWSYNASLTLSSSDTTDTAAGGYTDFSYLTKLVGNGTFDPIAGTGADSLAAGLLNGAQFSKSTSHLNTLHLGAQHDLFKLEGGASIVSLGADYSIQRYKVSYDDLILSQSGFSTQPASLDYPVGGNYGQVPFDAQRKNFGLFAEWLLPFTKTFEATLSARHDQYGKVYSRSRFSTTPDPVTGLQNQIPSGDVGNDFSASTYKLGLRWQPVDTLLLRGAYGTGFKAPSINDIAGAVTFGGSTSGSYACPFPGSPGCLPGSAQYDLLSGANGLSGSAGLKPEKSKQATLGFRVDPISSLSLGMDWWQVKITDQVLSGGIAEQVAFANPQQYAGLFVNPYADPAGFTTIAYAALPLNGGYAKYEGVDWDFLFRTNLSFGKLAVNWTGTYMLKQEYTSVPNGPVQTDLGVYGPDQAVVFRLQTRLAATLESGAFTNSLIVNYKSGYKDVSYVGVPGIFFANPDGSRGAPADFCCLDVGAYYTVDWQGKYVANKNLSWTAGIRNLFDKDPPLTLQNGGGGNQNGYDGRYTDPLGRQFYVRANYKF